MTPDLITDEQLQQMAIRQGIFAGRLCELRLQQPYNEEALHHAHDAHELAWTVLGFAQTLSWGAMRGFLMSGAIEQRFTPESVSPAVIAIAAQFKLKE